MPDTDIIKEAVMVIFLLIVMLSVVNQITTKAYANTDAGIKSFEPGLLQINAQHPQFECRISAEGYGYKITLPGMTFYSPKGEDLTFMIAADIEGSLTILGQNPDWNTNRIIEYLHDSPETGHAVLYAETGFAQIGPTGPHPNEYVKLSVWAASRCVKNEIKAGNTVPIGYDGLLAKCPGSYIAATTTTGTIGACTPAVMTTGRILLVKTDPGDRPIELYEYRLTNQGADEFNQPKCVVKATNEEGALQPDRTGTWYVEPGGMVKKSIGQDMCSGIMASCGAGEDYATYASNFLGKTVIMPLLKTPTDADSPLQKYTTDPKASADRLLGEETIGGAAFVAEGNDKCDNGSCELLSEAGGKHIWQPAYELLCDSGGYWNACIRDGDKIIIGGTGYTCKEGSWDHVV